MVGALPLGACGAEQASSQSSKKNLTSSTKMNPKLEKVTLAAGCFWCIEAVLQRIKGVEKVVSGYIGGTMTNPTYRQICTGETGHAEAVEVLFDPKVISFEKLLEVFWQLHDPTTLNRQGHDSGTQYRSAIFYHSDEQKRSAEESRKRNQAQFSEPIVTEITKASEFYEAEADHQEYYDRNKDKNPYCRAVIRPKLKKLGLETK